MMEKNQIFENIMSRTSVRSYTDMPVEPEKVEMMLRAGMAAPSACNKAALAFCGYQRPGDSRPDTTVQPLCQHGEAGTARHRGLRMP